MATPDTQPTWQVPDFFTSKPSTIAGYVKEVTEDCESLLKTTSQYKDVGRGFDLIAGRPDSSIQEQRSNLNSNRAKRSMREVTAALADTRQVDGFESQNKAFSDQVSMLNGAMKALYYERFQDRAMKEVVQWFGVTGRGFMWPRYRRTRMGPGAESALCFDAFGLLDVLQFMPAKVGQNQDVYGNIIVEMVPLPKLMSMFPTFHSKIKPMTKKRYDNSVANKRMSLAEMFRTKGAGNKISYEGNYGELRSMLIRDSSINTTGMPIPMGTKGGSESYIVPFIGQEIPTDQIQGGRRVTRKAGIEDCYFFPHMRLIMHIDGMGVPVYDGPNFDWSGMMPAMYGADEWPWERIGYSLIRDIYEIERARQHGERAIDQVARHRMDPSIGYDATRVATKEAEGFDPWKERGRLGFQGDADEKAWRMLLPDNMLNAPQWIFEWMKHLEEEGDYMLGLNQIGAMAKAKMGVGGDAMEKLLELSGPLVKDISRSMEPPTREVMEICKFNIFQWYGTRRLMTYLGPDGIAPTTFDFKPEDLYPSHLDGEDTTNSSSFSARERARIFATNLHLSITPNSLHAITQTSQKLLYLQLWRGGFPISPMTVAKALDIPNWGNIDGNTEFEQWQNYKKKEIEFASAMKDLAGSLQPAQPESGAGAGGGPKGKGGRPASGNKPPAAKVKGSAEGPRATVTES
jgi:hypothetical protein